MFIMGPADKADRSTMRFLNANDVRPAKICRRIVEVYKETDMINGNVRKYFKVFSKRQTLAQQKCTR